MGRNANALSINTILDRVDYISGGCWNWNSTVTENGYGHLSIKSKRYRPHRLIMHLYYGFPLDSKLLVCHVCDNRLCCNPRHLFIGTQHQNMIDCKAKGRLRGEFKPGFDIRRFREKIK